MAQSTVKNLMIEMKSFDGDSSRIRLDNPKEGISRAQVAEVMQPAFLNNWIYTDKGSTAGYLGETVLETSTKISLEGEDFYITPSSLSFNASTQGDHIQTVTITGAQLQGYQFKNVVKTIGSQFDLFATIADNGLSVEVNVKTANINQLGTFDFVVIVRGQEVTIPATIG